MPDESTTALVKRARRQDASALEALVRGNLRAAIAVALAVVRQQADAEDLAQESFLVAFQRLDTCREPERFTAWLLQIVRNRALNRLEQGRVHQAAVAQLPVASAIESGASERFVLRDRLLAALGHLTPVQREVVLLHDLEAWTHREIGAALDLAELSSRQHLFNARRTLREILKDEAPKGPS
jgi:RNA polymerase sigma-70 factor (ECF subfamily)